MEEKKKPNIKINRSALINISVYVIVTIATIVFSLFSVGFDVEKIMTSKFFGNLCLNYALALLIMVAAVRDSQTKQMNKDKNALNSVIDTIKQRTLISVFKYYTKDKFNRLKIEKIESILCKNGMDLNYYKMEIEQLKELLAKGKINKEQLQLVKDLKKGKFHFVSATSEEILSDYDDAAHYQTLKTNKKGVLLYVLGPKLILIFGTSALLTAVVATSSGNTSQVITDLISRLMNIVSALFAGYVAGAELAKEKARVFKEKTSFINEFFCDFDKGTYTPKPEELSGSRIFDTCKIFE